MSSVWVAMAGDPERPIAASGPAPGNVSQRGPSQQTTLAPRDPSGRVRPRCRTGRVPPGCRPRPGRQGRDAMDADAFQPGRQLGVAAASLRRAAQRRHSSGDRFVVSIEEGGATAAWLHATRAPGEPLPGRGARRLLAMAADQLAMTLRRDRLRGELTAAEVTRQSDALRGAILDSVSHDLRTPIASIRALAGGLADADGETDPHAVHATALAIDREGARLGDLVDGLLDMGRIQAGAIQPDLRPYDLGELVETTVRHLQASGGAQRLDGRHSRQRAAGACRWSPVRRRHGQRPRQRAPACRRRSRGPHPGRAPARRLGDGSPSTTPGPAFHPTRLPHLFDRFYRVPAGQEPARHGLGMGLAIARGFVEAMGGTRSGPSPATSAVSASGSTPRAAGRGRVSGPHACSSRTTP